MNASAVGYCSSFIPVRLNPSVPAGNCRKSSAELAGSEIGIDPGTEIEFRLVPKLLPRQGLIRFRPVLREPVRVIEIVRLQIRLEGAIQLGDDFIERPAPPRAGVENAAFFRVHRFNGR